MDLGAGKVGKLVDGHLAVLVDKAHHRDSDEHLICVEPWITSVEIGDFCLLDGLYHRLRDQLDVMSDPGQVLDGVEQKSRAWAQKGTGCGGENGPVAKLDRRGGDTGLIDCSGNGQLNFSVKAKPGYVFEEKAGPHRHLLKDPVLNRAIDVTFEGNIKIVMWNSGPDFSKFGESDDPSYGGRFLCLEGGTLYRDRAYTLAPGATHTLKATVAVRPFKPARFAMEGLSPAIYYDAAHAVSAGDPDADLAVIVVHGWGGGIKHASRDTLQAKLSARGAKPFIVSPLFPSRSVLEKAKVRDGRATWCNWKDGVRSPADDWRGGGDAGGTTISSFDVIDRMVATFSDKALYPAMKRIVLLGLSAGGQFVGRYVAVGKCPVRAGLKMEFAGIAPSTELRLDDDVEWHYGLRNRPRYSAALSRDAILANLSSRRVWRGCGTLDVTPGALDKSPEAMMQGINRYDRFRNFQEYIKAFPGWAKQVSFHDIPDVGHSGKTFDDPNLLDFICGR